MRKIWVGAIALGCAVAASAAYWTSTAPAQRGGAAAQAASTGDAAARMPAAWPVPAATLPQASVSAAAAEFSFQAPVRYAIAGDPREPLSPLAVAVGDVTGDGRDDLVVTVEMRNYPQPNGNKVLVYAQQANGTLAAPLPLTYTQITDSGASARGLTLGDMNNDGLLDIVLGYNGGIVIFLADGSGGFGPATISPVPLGAGGGGNYVAVAVIDFNQDGWPDVFGQTSFYGVRVHLGDGRGGFLPGAPIGLSSPWGGDFTVRAGDITGDGLPDVLTTTAQRSQVLAYVQLPGGGMAPPRGYYTPIYSGDGAMIAIGDINNDGRNDLLFNSQGMPANKKLGMYYQNPTGSLDTPVLLDTAANAYMMLATDLDRDGKTDVAVVHGGEVSGMGIYLQGDNGLLAERISPFPPNPYNSYAAHTIASGDLNGDGCTDVVFLIQNASVVNLGQGCKIRHPRIAAQDLDGNGKSDMIWLHGTGYLATWAMDGPTRLSGVSYHVGTGWRILASDDFDGDGKVELIWTDDRSMQMWHGNGSGGYVGLPMQPYPTGYRVVAHGDVDGDGKADLVWRDAANTAVSMWLMDGAQVIGSNAASLSPAWTVAGTGDLDGDQRADLIVSDGAQMRLWSGRGNGSFVDAALASYPSGWTLAGVADVDGDERSDLLWRHSSAPYFVHWKMSGSNRVAGTTYDQGSRWRVLNIADYNGDGRADVVWTDGVEMQLWASRNNGFTAQAMPAYPTGWTLQH